MREYSFNGNFLYYVRLIKKLHEQTLSKAAERCGITLPEADVLSFLLENPEFDTARDIALYREVSRAYVSKAVELLVAKEYLRIEQDKGDRRYQHLFITDNAQSLANELHNAQMAFYDSVTNGLTNEELAAMLSAIEKCAQNLTAIVDV